LEAFFAAERHHATACRLANDLCTVDRDRREVSCNALFVSDSPGEPALRARIRAELALGDRIISSLPGGARRSGRLLSHLARALVAFYDQRDFSADRLVA